MTKKDFVLIAGVLKKWLDNGDNKDFDGIYAVECITKKFCDTLSSKYPRFDREKFLKYCGLYD